VAFLLTGEELLLGRLGSGWRCCRGSSGRSGSISSRGSSSGRRSSRSGRRSGFFFFTASNQGSSSNQGCQKEGFIHVELPKGLKTISGNLSKQFHLH
jgi:hypothetical protein